MKIGDNVVLNHTIAIGNFKRHGIIIGIHSSRQWPLEILFADGIVEVYSRNHCRVISNKEYFKLQLS